MSVPTVKAQDLVEGNRVRLEGKKATVKMVETFRGCTNVRVSRNGQISGYYFPANARFVLL